MQRRRIDLHDVIVWSATAGLITLFAVYAVYFWRS